jgi:hypothetical protein
VAAAGDKAMRRFLEFVAVTIDNPNTRAAYFRACRRFFAWCDRREDIEELADIEPMHVAAYIRGLGKDFEKMRYGGVRFRCSGCGAWWLYRSLGGSIVSINRGGNYRVRSLNQLRVSSPQTGTSRRNLARSLAKVNLWGATLPIGRYLSQP